jgi:hypothetical protein
LTFPPLVKALIFHSATPAFLPSLPPLLFLFQIPPGKNFFFGGGVLFPFSTIKSTAAFNHPFCKFFLGGHLISYQKAGRLNVPILAVISITRKERGNQ